jgi:hypothetical protein
LAFHQYLKSFLDIWYNKLIFIDFYSETNYNTHAISPYEVFNMNSAPRTHEKRSIKVKDFLADLRSGMDEEYLLTKYQLTPVGLDKFYGMLVERGILGQDEIADRHLHQSAPQHEDTTAASEKPKFICPACLAVHDTMFDICPCCGVSFQEMVNEQTRTNRPVEEQLEHDYFPGQREQTEDATGDLFVSPCSNYREESAKVRVSTGNQLKDPTGGHGEFAQPFDWRQNDSRFDEPMDDIVCGMPLGENYAYEDKRAEHNGVRCATCQGAAVPALRDIYDRKRSLLSLTLCGISLFIGLVGAVVVSLFEGPSLARLLVVYVTGLLLLCGGVLCAVGSFLYLAREKVYYCASCGRVYPRG